MDPKLLADYGIDCEKGLSNCMDDMAFYKKILSMFLEDDCFERARQAHEGRAYQELFSCMHMLKGVSGNIALTGLYEAIVPLVNLLRNGTDEHAEVDRLFAEADAAYRRTCEGAAIIINEA